MMKDNQLYVNGKIVEELFLSNEHGVEVVTYDFRLEDLPGGHPTIPEGYVLVLGDNRTNSTDSRSIGLIPIKDIVGKASVIYWPFDRIQIIKE